MGQSSGPATAIGEARRLTGVTHTQQGADLMDTFSRKQMEGDYDSGLCHLNKLTNLYEYVHLIHSSISRKQNRGHNIMQKQIRKNPQVLAMTIMFVGVRGDSKRNYKLKVSSCVCA